MAWKPLGLHAALEMIQEEATKKGNPRYFRHENDLVLARGQFGKRREKERKSRSYVAYVLPSFLASHHDRHAWHMRSYHDQSRQASLSLFSLFFLRLTWARLRKEAHLDHARGKIWQ